MSKRNYKQYGVGNIFFILLCKTVEQRRTIFKILDFEKRGKKGLAKFRVLQSFLEPKQQVKILEKCSEELEQPGAISKL